MSEEKKEGSFSSPNGCGCCKCTKFFIGLLMGAFIFAAGVWFGKSHYQCHYQCHLSGGSNYCPFSAPVAK